MSLGCFQNDLEMVKLPLLLLVSLLFSHSTFAFFFTEYLLSLLLLLLFCEDTADSPAHLTYCTRIVCQNLRTFSYPAVAAILTGLLYTLTVPILNACPETRYSLPKVFYGLPQWKQIAG